MTTPTMLWIAPVLIILAMTERSTGTKSWRTCLDQAFGEETRPASYMFNFNTQQLRDVNRLIARPIDPLIDWPFQDGGGRGVSGTRFPVTEETVSGTGLRRKKVNLSIIYTGKVWFLKATTMEIPGDTYFAFLKPHTRKMQVGPEDDMYDFKEAVHVGTYVGSTVTVESDHNTKCEKGEELQFSVGGKLITYTKDGDITAKGYVLATDYVNIIVNAVTYKNQDLRVTRSPEVHVFVADRDRKLENSTVLQQAGRILCGQDQLSGLHFHTITQAVESAHHKCLRSFRKRTNV